MVVEFVKILIFLDHRIIDIGGYHIIQRVRKPFGFLQNLGRIFNVVAGTVVCLVTLEQGKNQCRRAQDQRQTKYQEIAEKYASGFLVHRYAFRGLPPFRVCYNNRFECKKKSVRF